MGGPSTHCMLQASIVMTRLVPRILLALILGLSVSAVGCPGCPSGSRSTGLVLRFIEDDPQIPFDQASLFYLTPAATSSILTLGDLNSWRPSGTGQEFVVEEGGATLRSSSRAAALRKSVDFDADAIDVLEMALVASDGDDPRIRLFWSHAGEQFSPDRLVLGRVTERSGSRVRYEFSLRGHPEWTGRISRLRFTFVLQSDEVLLRTIMPMRENVDEEQLARMTALGAKIELDSELRNALPGLPGVPLEKTLTPPAGSKLRFGYGLRPRVSDPVTFVVDAVSAGGSTRRLFEDTLASGNEQPGWHEAEVDLGAFGGQQILLRLTTMADVAPDRIDGLALWANPEVVSPPSAQAPPNIVLISIDTLRADRLSLYGYHRSTSPNLDAWARQAATVFQTTVAQGSWTLPSHVSMLTGINAHRHGANTSPASPSLEFLSDTLRDAGYATLAVTGGASIHPSFGFSQGFDRYRFWEGTGAERKEELETGLAKALQWIDGHRDRPFFLFFHTYAVHWPYRSRQPYYAQFTSLPPTTQVKPREGPEPEPEDGNRITMRFDTLEAQGDFEELSSGEFRELVSAAYDSGIAYTDAQLSRLLEKLDETGLNENTLVVITSDHGELLGEHGLASHLYLYDENLLVPLIIASPDGRGAGQTVRQQVRSIDIVPTILELAGMDALVGIDGRSLVPMMDDPSSSSGPPLVAWSYAAASNYGISLRTDNRSKYIYYDSVWAPIAGTEQLYSLQPIPDEMEDLAASAVETGELRRLLRESYLAEASGLRIQLENGGTSDFSGIISGPMVKPATVKSVDLPPEYYLARQGSSASFRVPPAGMYTLFLIEADRLWLELSLAAERQDGTLLTFDERIDVADLEGKLVFALTNAGWVRTTEEAQPQTYVALWWGGEFRPPKSSPLEADEELLRQLRALGYIR